MFYVCSTVTELYRIDFRTLIQSIKLILNLTPVLSHPLSLVLIFFFFLWIILVYFGNFGNIGYQIIF